VNREIKTILLTGGTGTLGSTLLPLLKDAGYKVFAPTREEFPVEDIIGVSEYLSDDKRFDCILHCAAWTDVKGAEKAKNKEKVIEVNIYGTMNMRVAAKWQPRKTKIVYISTDYVYDGVVGGYTPKSKPNPGTFYGWTKLAGESYMTPTDLIIRTSFCKRDTWGPTKKHLQAVFQDIYTTKDWVDVIAPKIVKALKRKGIIHISTKRKTLESLAIEDFPGVKVISHKDVRLGYDYPIDCSLN
tara:strand:+ start:613 stop:1338 length:726 start_codon:yes stop_codon:yes gene_type:complete